MRSVVFFIFLTFSNSLVSGHTACYQIEIVTLSSLFPLINYFNDQMQQQNQDASTAKSRKLNHMLIEETHILWDAPLWTRDQARGISTHQFPSLKNTTRTFINQGKESRWMILNWAERKANSFTVVNFKSGKRGDPSQNVMTF